MFLRGAFYVEHGAMLRTFCCPFLLKVAHVLSEHASFLQWLETSRDPMHALGNFNGPSRGSSAERIVVSRVERGGKKHSAVIILEELKNSASRPLQANPELN